MRDPKSLKNQVAVVTGASRGIGRDIALRLASLGADVAFSYNQSETQAQQLEKEILALGVRARASKVDIKDFAAVKAWMDETRTHFGQLDILVNNAGIIIDKALMMMAPEDWHQVIETNLTGVFNASRSAIVTFMKQKKGNIVNISSVSGIIGLPRQINYSASKGGVNAFTKALAKEVASFGIRVNAVAPGFIDTEILAGFNEQQKEKILKLIPLARLGNVSDVSNCVEFLLSEGAQYITGQILVVDGGLAIR